MVVSHNREIQIELRRSCAWGRNDVCRSPVLKVKIFQGNKQWIRTISFVMEALLVPRFSRGQTRFKDNVNADRNPPGSGRICSRYSR